MTEETAVSLRAYTEALFTEGQRATEMAERERSKAADALTTERFNAATTAEREREKAAQALARTLTQQIEAGDRALHDHVEGQVKQLTEMLSASRRENDIRSEEQQKAISKAEVSYDKRFEAVNALRGQMSDLIASHQKALSELTSALMPREVGEAKIEELSKKIDANTSRLDRLGGRDMGEAGFRQRSQFTTTTLIAVAVAVVAVLGLVIAVANFATV